MTSKSTFLLGCALLLALPLGALLPGCGGGNSRSSSSAQNYTSSLNLTTSQAAQLSLSVREGLAGGTLSVADRSAQGQRSAQAFSFVVPGGKFPLLGSFTKPNFFSVSGTFPGVGAFTIVGQIPVEGGSGNYVISTKGESVTGSFKDANTTPTATSSATATATRTATPIPARSSTSINATLSATSGTNVDTSAFATSYQGNPSFSNRTRFNSTTIFEVPKGSITRRIAFDGPLQSTPAKAGDVFPVGNEGADLKQINISYSEKSITFSGASVEKSWISSGGQLKITSATSAQVVFSLENVLMKPAFNSGGATGTWTLNGSGQLAE